MNRENWKQSKNKWDEIVEVLEKRDRKKLRFINWIKCGYCDEYGDTCCNCILTDKKLCHVNGDRYTMFPFWKIVRYVKYNGTITSYHLKSRIQWKKALTEARKISHAINEDGKRLGFVEEK